MYVKSTAVLLQALGIISIGTLADTAYWRKRLLFTFAFVGSSAAAIFLVLPGTPGSALPVVAAFITLVGNVCYAASIVCANAFLPGLAREEVAISEAAGPIVHQTMEDDLEAEALLDPPDKDEAHDTLVSRTIGRLSATGTAIGFFSGVAMLALLSMPVTVGKGSTRSLMLAVGLSGAWWAVFSIPAALGLPGGRKEAAPKQWLYSAWAKVGGMVRPSHMKELPNLFIYLLAWIFLSDGEHSLGMAMLTQSQDFTQQPTQLSYTPQATCICHRQRSSSSVYWSSSRPCSRRSTPPACRSD